MRNTIPATVIGPAIALAVAMLLTAGPGHATPPPDAVFPGLIDVVDVAADDVLNIRAEPHAGAPIIGTLPPDAAGIEVIESRDGWLRVTRPETSGWVSARFARMHPGLWQADALPAGLVCHGTEPFWSLTLAGGAARFASPQSVEDYGDARVLSPFDAAENPRRAITAQGLTALITPAPALCSDGMSDALYALDADLILGTGAGSRYLRGCCSIGR